MADPKIRYDIGATVTGDAEINKLAAELEKLDSSLDPALAERARLTAQRLRELGEQGAAVDQFVRIKQASEAAAAGLDQAQAQAQAFARELSAVAAPTRAQAGQFEKLKDEVNAAKLALQTQTAALDASRGALTALGIPTEGLARRQADLRNELASTATELRQIGDTAGATRGLAQIAAQTDAAASGLAAAQAAAQGFAARIAAAEQPTAAEVAQLDRLAESLQQGRAALDQQVQALAAQRSALVAAGTSTDALEAKQSTLANQLAETERTLRQMAGQNALASLGRGSAEVAAQLDQAQAAVQAFAAKLAASQAPTEREVQALNDLSAAVDKSRGELEQQAATLTQQRAALIAAGVPTDALEAKQAELAAQLAQTGAELKKLSTQGGSLAAFSQLVSATESARDALFLAERALEDFRGGMTGAAAPTQSQSRRLGELAEAARAAQIALQAAAQAQAASAGQLRSAGIDVDRYAAAQTKAAAQTSAVAQASREAAAAAALQGRTFVSAANQQVQAASSVREQVAGIGRQLQTLQSLAAAAIGGQFLGGMAADLGRTADEYTNLAARIKLVTGEGAAFDAAFEGVFDVATRTNSTLESTGTLFARLAAAGKSIGVTSQQALALTESINQAVQISGSSAQGSDAAIQQLIQGLQSGVLRGEEFNSVMEQAPRLANALADGLGVTTGELRKLAEAGQLTSTTVIQALQGQSAALQREFETLPPTIGRALTNLTTEWTRYVGEADKANGISAAAARALQSLANNLDTVAAALIGVGKAVLAYQALKLAQSFASAGTAATAAATQIATIGPAMTSAATSSAAAATNMGRFAGILSGLKTFGLVGLLTNLPAIGTALGEGIAKLVGYRDRMDEVEAADKRAAEAGKRLAQEKAALSQQLKQASDQALGLVGRSRELVAEFDGLRIKGESAADALAKIGKSLDLTGLQGIRDAASALDALAVQGKITGDQMREALAGALKGEDLAIFATQARAAFDGSEQGARRLAAAIDSVDSEALRRAGTSADELRTGFSSAANSAINDVDALVTTLGRLGIEGDSAGRALSTSLNKAVETANTERAVQAVIDRFNALGQQGLLTGDQLAEGLDKARSKLDSLTPGVQGLNESLQTFGLKSQSQLQQTANNFSSAWDQIRTSTQVGLADKLKAFEQYKAAAVAANGGVVSSEIKLQEEMLRSQAAAQGLGESFKTLGDSGSRQFQRVGESAALTTAQIERAQAAADKFSRPTGTRVTDGAKRAADGSDANTYGSSVSFGALGDLKAKRDAGTLTADDLEAAQAAMLEVQKGGAFLSSLAKQSAGSVSSAAVNSQNASESAAKQILEYVTALASAKAAPAPTQRQTITTDATGQRVTTPANTAGSTTHTVNINLNGSTRTINAASASDANALKQLLQDLAAAKSVAQ